jgi:hypothetical protein
MKRVSGVIGVFAVVVLSCCIILAEASQPRAELIWRDLTESWVDLSILQVSFLPDSGGTVVLVAETEQVMRCDLQTGKCKRDDSVTHNGLHMHKPVWSPGGMRVAFLAFGEGRSVYVYDSTKRTVARLGTSFRPEVEPTWLNEEEILISKKEGSVVAVNVVTGLDRRIAENGEGGLVVGYSKGSQRIFFVRPDGYPTFGVFEARVENGRFVKQKRIFPEKIGADASVSVSLDGRYLVYTDLRRGEICGATLVEVPSGKRVEFAVEKGWSDDYAYISPDGKTIVALSRKLESGRGMETSGPYGVQRRHARFSKISSSQIRRWFGSSK